MVFDKLIERSMALNNPTTIMLDATLDDIPSDLLDRELSDRWATPKAASMALFEFHSQVIDALSATVPAVTLNFASYLKYGACGIAAYRDTIKVAQDAGVFTIADGKFSEIGVRGKSLSASHLGTTNIGRIEQPMFDVDFITHNPFFATEGIDAFVGDANKYDKGIFVVVRTNDKGSQIFQDMRLSTAVNQTLWQEVLRYTKIWGDASKSQGEKGYNRVGAYLATRHQDNMADARKDYPNTFFYVPGNCNHPAPAFTSEGHGAIIENNTVIRAHKENTYEGMHWLEAIKMAAAGAREQWNAPKF